MDLRLVNTGWQGADLPKGEEEVGAEEVFAVDVALQPLGRRTRVEVASVLLPPLLHRRHRPLASLHHATLSNNPLTTLNLLLCPGTHADIPKGTQAALHCVE